MARLSTNDHVYLDAPIKRVYVCTPFRGVDFNGVTPSYGVLKENTRVTLWCCHELVRDNETPVAPFAPQAFYPYFWPFLKPNEQVDDNRWNAWFERALEVLKICDAVYVYTAQGLPDQSLSKGMQTVVELAHSLGIEVQYRKLPTVDEKWRPALPNFNSFEKTLTGLEQSVA